MNEKKTDKQEIKERRMNEKKTDKQEIKEGRN